MPRTDWALGQNRTSFPCFSGDAQHSAGPSLMSLSGPQREPGGPLWRIADHRSRSPAKAPIVVVVVGRAVETRCCRVVIPPRHRSGTGNARFGSFHAIWTPRCHGPHQAMQRQDDGWLARADGDANPNKPRPVGTLRRRRASEALSGELIPGRSTAAWFARGMGSIEEWQMAAAKRVGPSWALVYTVTPFTAVPGPRYVAGHGHSVVLMEGEGGP